VTVDADNQLHDPDYVHEECGECQIVRDLDVWLSQRNLSISV